MLRVVGVGRACASDGARAPEVGPHEAALDAVQDLLLAYAALPVHGATRDRGCDWSRGKKQKANFEEVPSAFGDLARAGRAGRARPPRTSLNESSRFTIHSNT